MKSTHGVLITLCKAWNWWRVGFYFRRRPSHTQLLRQRRQHLTAVAVASWRLSPAKARSCYHRPAAMTKTTCTWLTWRWCVSASVSCEGTATLSQIGGDDERQHAPGWRCGGASASVFGEGTTTLSPIVVATAKTSLGHWKRARRWLSFRLGHRRAVDLKNWESQVRYNVMQFLDFFYFVHYLGLILLYSLIVE